MFMHSFSDRVTLDRNEVYKEPSEPPMKYVTPNAGIRDDKVGTAYEYPSDDEEDGDDDAITQVQADELSSSNEDFVTPKKRKASEVSRNMELLDDSDSDSE
jgi:hypothetical protein